MTLVPWWCLFVHVMGFNGHIYRHGKSWNGYNFHTYPHPAKKPALPRDIMVDVINNVGLKLLAIHNEYNENNIAISPYGALSVIIALGEGLEGDSVHEIQQATHIPNDISVIRVGLRDIHRHLKSYFIPKEGFLAGLTLNHENVTLRPEYEDILRFYGYDTATFNNALYPQPETPGMPETTTEGLTTTVSQVTTEMGRSNAVEMTTEGITASTLSSETTTVILPTEKTTTLPVTTIIRTTEETTLTIQQTTTTELPQTTEVQTTQVITVQMPVTTVQMPVTTVQMPITTTERPTVSELPATEETSTSVSFVTTQIPSTQESTFEMDMIQSVSTTEEVSTTEIFSTSEITTSSVLPTSTSTAESFQAGTTNIPTTLVTTTQSSTSLPLETTVDNTTVDLPTTTESVGNIADVTLSTATTGDDTSTLVTEGTTIPFAITEDTTLSTTVLTTTINTTPNDISTEKDNDDNEIDSTDSSVGEVGFGGISKRKVRSDATRTNQTNVIQLNIRDNNFDFKRNSRSVVDYILARYYDDQFNFNNNPEPYVPDEQPSFLIYGKYREYNINFMKYNTILPFHYEPHLNALALSFPLDSTKYYLLLLLPVDETGIDKLICDLRLNGSLKYIIANLKYRHVVATIPSFMLKGYVTLTPSFQKLGIRKVFEPRQADFSPMTTQRGIYVTNIEQAITVNIRNYVDPSAIPDHRNLHRYDPVHFKADHPFLYFVIDSDINVTLMAGKIVNPLNSRIS